MWLFPSVFHYMFSQAGNSIGWKIALPALLQLLPRVDEQVHLQMSSCFEWLLALNTTVTLFFVCPLVTMQPISIYKYLRTQVTRIFIGHCHRLQLILSTCGVESNCGKKPCTLTFNLFVWSLNCDWRKFGQILTFPFIEIWLDIWYSRVRNHLKIKIFIIIVSHIINNSQNLLKLS